MSDEAQLHDRLRTLLPNAQAESCQVVATFLDIRGFSSFSAQGESFNSALYLRSVYTTILSSHFDDATFFKPTGDGLLLIHQLPLDAQAVPQIVSSVLARAVALVRGFAQLTADDYMINFPVPQKLGVGIARGSATRLISDGGALDYTGRCLNLAARLMDKARPSGVVFADTHAKHLMTPEVALSFRGDEVCIRGIAELEPIPIMISSDVEIAESDREPIPAASNRWGESHTLSVAEVRESSGHGFYLRRAPQSDERVGVLVEYPIFDKNGKQKDSISWLNVYGEYLQQPHGPLVTIDFKAVKERIKQLPETTTSKILGFTHTKTTYVTFTPFCEAMDEE